ncbi:MAG: hypothetical protein ABL955_06005, partial [Elusimicrobiota bacterium]
EVGQRHRLKPINIFTPSAQINGIAPLKYRGLDRFEARRVILEDLEAIVAKNMASRAEAVAAARRVVDAKTAEFGEWANSLSTGQERSLKHSDYTE